MLILLWYCYLKLIAVFVYVYLITVYILKYNYTLCLFHLTNSSREWAFLLSFPITLLEQQPSVMEVVCHVIWTLTTSFTTRHSSSFLCQCFTFSGLPSVSVCIIAVCLLTQRNCVSLWTGLCAYRSQLDQFLVVSFCFCYHDVLFQSHCCSQWILLF